MLIDPYQERWLDRLGAEDDSLPAVYLLADGVFVPGLYRLINAVLPSSQVPTLLFECLPGCSDETRDVSPFLFRYQPSNIRLQRLLDSCSGWPMLSAIETTESQAKLTERLAAWCVVEADGQRFNFRFPDTGRLPAIFNALTASQRAGLAGPAKRWSYIDRNGDWAELAVTSTPCAITARAELDGQQFGELVSASEVDEVISILRYRGHQVSGPHSQCYTTICGALWVANKVDLDAAAKLDWCEACLRDGLANDEFQAAAQFAQWTSHAVLTEQNLNVL